MKDNRTLEMCFEIWVVVSATMFYKIVLIR